MKSIALTLAFLGAAHAADCGGVKLVTTQSGPDDTCPTSTNLHYWPVASSTDCHVKDPNSATYAARRLARSRGVGGGGGGDEGGF